MPKAYFMVRAVVADDLRDRFDHWYSTDHLPWAMKEFKCEKARRFWSVTEECVHYAVYEFADQAHLDTAMKSPGLKDLIADFDRSWPAGVTRTRDLLTLAEERAAQ
jgi:hypothetical protein